MAKYLSCQHNGSLSVDGLAGDPGLSGAEFAQSYPISLSQLVRLFKAQVGLSIVEYRNRLRLDRFWKSVIEGECNLMKASKDAGFGSYALFHRVFGKAYGDTPSVALRRRPEGKPDRKGSLAIPSEHWAPGTNLQGSGRRLPRRALDRAR